MKKILLKYFIFLHLESLHVQINPFSTDLEMAGRQSWNIIISCNLYSKTARLFLKEQRKKLDADLGGGK